MWFWKEIFICLIIITTVQANLICPEVKDCKCREILKDSIEIRCPEYDNALNIQLNSGKSAILVCSALIEGQKQFEIIEKLLPELNFTIDQLQINNCALPTNKSLAELLKKFNMDKVSELEVISLNVTCGKFHSNHFDGLTNLIILKINCPDYKNVPKDVFNQLHQLTHLNLSNNCITELNDETFWKTINLLCLDLSHNQLTNISQNLFSNLTKLTEIRLNNNQIHFIDSNAFENNLNLLKVCMQHNQLVAIDEINFSYENVGYLDLSFNNISDLNVIYRFACYVKSNEITFNLENNNIENIMSYALIEELYKKSINIFGEKKLKFDLGSNPINCDCQLYDFLQILNSDYNIIEIRKEFMHLYQGDIKCYKPDHLNGVSLIELELSDIVCPLDKRLNVCPEPCICLRSPATMNLLINCTERELDNTPKLEDIHNLNFQHIELLITDNFIENLPTQEYFSGFGNIDKIFATNNQIKILSLANIPPLLKFLHLANNSLTTIAEEVLSKIKGQNIKVFLSKNPFTCDCSTALLINMANQLSNLFVDFGIMTCANGQLMKHIDTTTLCVDLQLVMIILGAILLSAIFMSFGIYYKYQKQIKIWLYAHNWCLWLVLDKETEENKYYDAFIVFAHQDDQYVNDLVSKLESGPNPYKCCIHLRDWAPGELIPIQIVNSVKHSRRTIIVLSEHFHESRWANWEFRVAQSSVFADGRSRVIVIIKGDVDMELLDEELQCYLRINTYVKADDPWFWKKLRYAMPHINSPALVPIENNE
ncbi:unnamed protein product [Diamesa hyperborea]